MSSIQVSGRSEKQRTETFPSCERPRFRGRDCRASAGPCPVRRQPRRKEQRRELPSRLCDCRGDGETKMASWLRKVFPAGPACQKLSVHPGLRTARRAILFPTGSLAGTQKPAERAKSPLVQE